MPSVMRAYRFALDPTPVQERALASQAGAARFAFNWALAAVRANIGQRAAERSYGLSEQDLTPLLNWNLQELRKAWNQAKHRIAPWWNQCSKEAFNTGLEGVVRALKNWSDSKSGKRSGHPVGFPRFKSRHRSTQSARFTTGAIRVETDRHHVTLPRIGQIRTHESTRKLARRLEADTARVLSASIRREANRWFCSFTVQVERSPRIPARPGAVVAIDLGLKNLAVLSTGECVPNPRHLSAALRKIRRLSRKAARQVGPYDLATKSHRQASKKWKYTTLRLGQAHARVANLRRDGLHKLTTRLTSTYGVIVIEDLNVAGMLRNRRLARHISDAAWAEVRRQLGYKTKWNGGMLYLADRYFPSSKMCSQCGAVKAKLPLRIRVFECDHCAAVMDRDLNAAHNLAALVVQNHVAGGGLETRNARRADLKTPFPGRVATKREPGAVQADQTGTADVQAPAAGRWPIYVH